MTVERARPPRHGRTPTKAANPRVVWLGKRALLALALVGFVVLALVAWQARAALYTALGGFALALVLSFPVAFFSRFVPRWLAILVSFVLLAGLLLLTLWAVIPVLSDQLSALLASAPAVLREAQAAVRALLEPLSARGLLPGDPEAMLSGITGGIAGRLRDFVGGLPGQLFGIAGQTVQLALAVLGSVVVAAYMLADARRIKAAYLRAAPEGWRPDARELWESFGFTISRYVSGLALIMLAQGVLSAAMLWLLGVPFAFALSLWVAATAVVPLFGAWIGAVPAVLVALSVSPAIAGATALLFLAIQQLEGNFLTPRVQGGILRVHPILILLSVVAAGQLAGPVGVLLAVPALAVIRVLVDFLGPRLRAKDEARERELGGC